MIEHVEKFIEAYKPYSLLAPEICILNFSCLLLLFGVFTEDKRKVSLYLLALTGIIVTMYMILAVSSVETQVIFNGAYKIDKFATSIKIIIMMALSFVWMIGRDYATSRGFFTSEYLVLNLLSVLGMMILASCADFLTMYLGLELMALPLYAMIVSAKGLKINNESAIKYFVIGAVGAAIILYGISLIYGVNGSLNFQDVGMSSHSLTKYGMVLILAGIFIEFGLVPFHFWLPDVYQASPTKVTAFIASMPKIAIFAMAYRLCTDAFLAQVGDWYPIFMVISLLSIIVGNILAINQINLKRMLAFSAMSHIGYVLLGLATGASLNYSHALYYLLIYMLMSMTMFGVIMWLSRDNYEIENINDLSGLIHINPLATTAITLIMFSMAGLPPLVGFYAKFVILNDLIQLNYIFPAIIAFIFSVIGSFYYLRIVKIMIFDDLIPNHHLTTESILRAPGIMLIMASSVIMLMLGIFPSTMLFIADFVI